MPENTPPRAKSPCRSRRYRSVGHFIRCGADYLCSVCELAGSHRCPLSARAEATRPWRTAKFSAEWRATGNTSKFNPGAGR